MDQIKKEEIIMINEIKHKTRILVINWHLNERYSHPCKAISLT